MSETHSHESNPMRSSERHRCPLCGRVIAGTHFKRHLAAHDRRVAPGTQPAPGATKAAWLAFLDGQLRGVE